MTFTLMPRKVEERVPAYEVCNYQKEYPVPILGDDRVNLVTCRHGIMHVPNGNKYTADPNSNYDERPCPDCQGFGGKWHEAVEYRPGFGDSINADNLIITVSKSSFLVREWGPCIYCLDSGDDCVLDNCSRCQGTGAEPGTASPWRVSE